MGSLIRTSVCSRIKTKGKTDPYGHLEWCVGSMYDFVCFDFYIDGRRKRVLLHAVVNSETGHFIMNFGEPKWVPFSEAITAALNLVHNGVEWCWENKVRFNQRNAARMVNRFAREVAKAMKQGA